MGDEVADLRVGVEAESMERQELKVRSRTFKPAGSFHSYY
jgi:hypothetical protein